MSEEAVNTEVSEATGAEGVSTESVADATTEQVAFVDSMLEQISDEGIKTHKMWDNLKGKSADELGQYIKELKSFAGKKGDIPKADASDEEWNAFYEKLGRPESVEGYEFGLNDEFKGVVGEEATPFFEDAIKWFKESAFSNGLSAEKAEALVDGYLDMVANQYKEGSKTIQEQAEANDKALRSEWGDGYDGIMGGIKALLRNNGMSDEDISSAEAAGVLKEPALAKALGKISAQFEDDPQIGHHHTKTVSGLKDQFNEVNGQIAEYMKKGERVPPHITQKRVDLMNKLGEDI